MSKWSPKMLVNEGVAGHPSGCKCAFCSHEHGAKVHKYLSFHNTIDYGHDMGTKRIRYQSNGSKLRVGDSDIELSQVNHDVLKQHGLTQDQLHGWLQKHGTRVPVRRGKSKPARGYHGYD